ncbi:MAG: nucleotidyltransferase family protein, partial [Bacilli bacterium]
MEKIGIIAEYNPFHNGHLYHLNKAKELFPNGTFILVLVGNFTQRGDVSIINKWDKAKLALNNGFDLVVELPYIFATSSADVYATGAIETLNNLKCNYLIFGSETNDINLFEFLAKESVNNTEYDLLLKSSLAKGLNFPSACSSALKSVTNTEINKPNDILALEY